MSVPSSQEIRRTKQVLPAEKRKKWAEDAGFELRPAKGSHIRCVHKIYPDIWFNLILTTRKLASQRDFADALLEIEKRNLQKAFTASAQKEQLVLEKIPDHLQGHLDSKTGSLVITDRQLPQLGITIQPKDFHLIENKIRNILEPQKKEIFARLGWCRSEHDIDFSIPKHGVFDGVLAHKVYSIAPIVIPPYKMDDDIGHFDKFIDQYIATIENKDKEHEDRLNKILGMNFISEIDVVSHSRRGDRTYVVHYTSPRTHRDLQIDFHAHSNRRVTLEREKDATHNPVDLHRGRVSEMELAQFERRIFGIVAAQAQTDGPNLARS